MNHPAALALVGNLDGNVIFVSCSDSANTQVQLPAGCWLVQIYTSVSFGNIQVAALVSAAEQRTNIANELNSTSDFATANGIAVLIGAPRKFRWCGDGPINTRALQSGFPVYLAFEPMTEEEFNSP